MNGILATFRRELMAYFVSPMAYVVLAVFLLINGWVFALILGELSSPQGPPLGSPMQLLFSNVFLYLLIFPGVCILITMRLLSEERRSGTIEVLMTAPITEVQVVLGKYFAALAFYACLWLPTVLYAVILNAHDAVDWGPVAAGYLGLLGVGAFFLAVGTFASSLSRSQIVAAVVALAAYFFLLLLPTLMEGSVLDARWRGVLEYLNLWTHLSEMSRGIVDTRHLVYYASATVFFLFLSSRALAANKWR